MTMCFTPALSRSSIALSALSSATWSTTAGFSANNILTRSSSPAATKPSVDISIPPLVLAKAISRSVVTRPPAETSWAAITEPRATSRCTALNAAANRPASATVGASAPRRFMVCPRAEPPSFSESDEKSTYINCDFLGCITGLTVRFTSVTSPAAEMITVPGANTLSSPYF